MTTASPTDIDITETVTEFLRRGHAPKIEVPASEPEDTVDIAPPIEDDDPYEPEDGHDDGHVHVDYEVDQPKLDAAGADPLPWAAEFARFLGTTTGQWVDTETISNWFNAYGARVQQHTFRQSAFVVANTSLPATAQGDPAFLLLALRDDLTSSFRKKAGL